MQPSMKNSVEKIPLLTQNYGPTYDSHPNPQPRKMAGTPQRGAPSSDEIRETEQRLGQ